MRGRNKPSKNAVVGLAMGIIIGAAFGWIFDNVLIGAGLGISFGIGIKESLDKKK